MICFVNPGEIDIRGATIMGLNAKEGAGAIGYFGTGLKYAIAVLLREGQRVEIWSGLKRYAFDVEQFEFRGKIVAQVTMNGEKLGFTLDYGKNWGLAEAYRELWSNAKDEGGGAFEDRGSDISYFVGAGEMNETTTIDSRGMPRPGETRIKVYGEAFAKIHDQRFGQVLLPEGLTLLGADHAIEIYHGVSNFFYYKGIRVFESKRPFALTYNIVTDITLTEDRTPPAGSYYLDEWVKSFAVTDASEAVAEALFCCGEQYHESGLSFDYKQSASEASLKAIEGAFRKRPQMLTESAKGMLFRLRRSKGDKMEYVPVELSSGEQGELDRALAELESWGYRIADWKLVVTESCGQGVLGLALMSEGTIVLARSTLGDCDKLRGTLIEEYVHLRFKVGDKSLQMQDCLVNEIVRMGYELNKNRAEQDMAGAIRKDDSDEILF